MVAASLLLTHIGRTGSNRLFPTVKLKDLGLITSAFKHHRRLFSEAESEPRHQQFPELHEDEPRIMKVLNVAEKNDAAKNIAKTMCGNQIPPSRRGEANIPKKKMADIPYFMF